MQKLFLDRPCVVVLLFHLLYCTLSLSLSTSLTPSPSLTCLWQMGSSQPYPRSSFSNQSHSQSSSQGHHSHGHGKVDSHSHPPQSHFGAENRNFNHGGNHGNSEEPHDNCESMGDEFGNNLESMSIDDGKSIFIFCSPF
jgi:hypothetical protein